MLIAALVFAASSLGSGLALSIYDFTVWRFLGGIGVGVASVIAPMYIAEVAPAHMRGRLGSLQQLAIVIGIFAALMVDAFLARTAGGAAHDLWLGLAAWRWMFLVGLVPAIVYGVLALQIPESPRYLVARGKLDTAAGVLSRLLGPINVAARVAQIAATMKTQTHGRVRDLRGPRFGLLPIVWVGIILSMLQQLVGINVIFYYSTSLWRSVGLSESDALTISVVTSVTNVLVTVLAIALIDRVGRRPLLLVGSLGMAVCLGAMAACFTQVDPTSDVVRLAAPFGTIALVAANAYVVFFGMSWGPVVWVLLGEMFPNRVRAPRPGARGRRAMGCQLRGERQLPRPRRARGPAGDLRSVRLVRARIVHLRRPLDHRDARQGARGHARRLRAIELASFESTGGTGSTGGTFSRCERRASVGSSCMRRDMPTRSTGTIAACLALGCGGAGSGTPPTARRRPAPSAPAEARPRRCGAAPCRRPPPSRSMASSTCSAASTPRSASSTPSACSTRRRARGPTGPALPRRIHRANALFMAVDTHEVFRP